MLAQLNRVAPAATTESGAGFRPRVAGHFCFGKSTQNHSLRRPALPPVGSAATLEKSGGLGTRRPRRLRQPGPCSRIFLRFSPGRKSQRVAWQPTDSRNEPRQVLSWNHSATFSGLGIGGSGARMSPETKLPTTGEDSGLSRLVRRRVPEPIRGKAERCLSPGTRRVLSAPESVRNGGNAEEAARRRRAFGYFWPVKSTPSSGDGAPAFKPTPSRGDTQ